MTTLRRVLQLSAEAEAPSAAEESQDGERVQANFAQRMLPSSGLQRELLDTVQDFSLDSSLHNWRMSKETTSGVVESRRSGFRSEQDAQREFVLISANERVGCAKKKNKRSIVVDEPCQCAHVCDRNCINRTLQMECNPETCPVYLRTNKSCGNMRIGDGEDARRVEVQCGGMKGCGLFALEDIPASAFIIEYVGEVVDDEECARRLATDYREEKHKYLMCINGGSTIDATRKGNLARFINHSCEPNCVVQEWTVRGESRMGIFALQNIECQEELAFNYNFQRFGEGAQRCFCGAKSCVGWLGRGANEAPLQWKPKLGYDPVLHDNVGLSMDESAARKTEIFIRNLVLNGVPKHDAERAVREQAFLVRNVKQALVTVYGSQGSFGW